MKKYTNHSENVALVCIIAIVAGLSSVLMTTSRQNRTGSGFPDDHLGSSVIVISTPVTYTAQTLTYDQDISITSTGSLHFDSCSVTMNSTMAHPALKIVVQRGGVLNITVSTIQASSAAYPYNIRVYGTLDAQGTDFWQSGFDTSDVTKSALYLNDAEHVRLIGCTIGVTTNGKGLHAVRGTDIDLNSVDFVGYMRAGATFDETNGLVLYGLAIFDSGSATNTIGLELINVSNAFLNETTISDFATSARFAGDCRNVTSINLQTIRTALVAGSIGCLVEPSASGGVPDDVILDGVYPTRQDVGMKIAGLVNRAITLSNVNIVTTNTAASFTNCMGLTVTNMNARSTNQLGYYFSNVTNTNILNARFQTTFPLNATRLDRGSDIVFENSTLNSTGSGSKDFVLQDSSNVTFFNSEFSEVKSAILSPTSHMLKGNYIRVFARDTNQIPIHGALVQKHSDGPGMSANFTTNSAGRVFRIPGIYRTLNALYISTMYNVTIEISYLGLTFTGSPTAILDLRTPLSLIFGASGILVDPWVISDPVSYNNREFIINGDLVINSTAIFTSCRIRMFSTGLVNRSIIILDAGYLIADYTNFTTYSGYSFKFNATSGSSTALSNCIVMDAGWQSYDGIHMEPIDLIKSGMYFLEPEVVRLSFCLITGSPVLVTLDSSSTSEALLEYSTFQSDLVAPNDIGVLLLDCARVRVDSNNFYDLDTGVLLNTTSPYAGIENVISYNEFTVNDKSGIKGIVSK
nr:hypothetical protein [Candidatus Sigynarchaeota archaeon]